VSIVSRSAKQLLVTATVVASVALPSAAAHAQRAASRVTAPVTKSKIGDPAWEPVDFNLFAAPVGTAANGYSDFGRTQQKILPPPHYEPHTGLGIGPGTPEQPPYDHDVSNGVSANGYVRNGPFTVSQFSAPSGVWLTYMVIPTALSTNRGSSPDFADGPIIPNSLFPIEVHGVLYRNGAVYDPFAASFKVPALNDPSVQPPFDVDGHSHFPIFIADNSDFGPSGTPSPGSYTFRITMRDRTHNGWAFTSSFRVVGTS
jgi:hypothetical protein